MSAKPFEFIISEGVWRGDQWLCQAKNYDIWIMMDKGKYYGRIDKEWDERGVAHTKPTSTLKQTVKKLMEAYKPLAQGREEYARIEATIKENRL